VSARLPTLASGRWHLCGSFRQGRRGQVFLAERFLGLGRRGPVARPPALVAAPLAWRAAAERDRRQKVSPWDELHHRAIGDPLSWSAR
jgi:hypothetical protein